MWMLNNNELNQFKSTSPQNTKFASLFVLKDMFQVKLR